MNGTIWCLHGAVGEAADWEDWTVDGWAVRRVDLWRFLDCCPMSLAAFGDALNREAESLGGPRVLLGYSMGGRLALQALAAGGPWAAAVIISAHPGLEDAAQRSRRLASDAVWASRALSGDWAGFLADWNRQGVLEPGNRREADERRPADRRGLVARRREIARSFIDWSLGAQPPLWDRLGSIRAPLLWVAGERDAKFRALAERAAALAGARGEPVAIAPGAGHRVPWEAPEWLASRVGKFLSARVSGPQ